VFGIGASEWVVLLAVAAIVLGPERLPEYAQQLARLVRELRRMAQGATEQVRSELGPEFDEVDWRKLDPRQYDPRRIVREALSDVWDPDDPLGLKELEERTSGKQVSRGGPRDQANPRAPDRDENADPGSGPGGTAPDDGAAASLPYDPDAT
jgi:sec-independent protein translocase protein TatB